jgi:hypothetical protein
MKSRVAGWTLVIASFAVFVRSLTRTQLWDFAVISTAARAWVAGHDPYDQAYLNQWWAEHAASSSHITTDVSWLPQVVPPTTQLAMAPFAIGSIDTSRFLWLAFVTVSVVLQALALYALASKATTVRRLLLVAYSFAMGPLALGVISGQPSVPAVAAIVVAAWAASNGRDALAAVLLGFAAALKMQIAVPIMIMYAYLRRYKVGLGGLAVFAVIGFAAWGRLQLADAPDWQRHWQENLGPAMASGGTNDFSLANPARWHLVNLQVLVNVLVPNRSLTLAISWLVLAAVVGVFVRTTWRTAWQNGSRDPERELLFLAFAAPLTLLPIYHRYYDATLMTLTMAWALEQWDAPRPEMRRAARWSAFVLLLLLPPLVLSPSRAIDLGYLPKWLDTNWIWNLTITAHHAWTLLLVLLAMLLAVLARFGDEERGLEPVVGPGG